MRGSSQPAAWFVIGVILLCVFGGSFEFDPTDTGNGPHVRANGILSWYLLERRRREAAEDKTAAEAGEALSEPTTDTARAERPRERPVPPSIPDRTYTLNGSNGRAQTWGAFATVHMPGLEPGSHMVVSLEVPSMRGKEGGYIRFDPVTVGSSGVFEALLPRHFRNLETGDDIDLAEWRYRFYLATDDARYSSCGSRYAVMIEGRPRFGFNGGHVFCGGNDPVPELVPSSEQRVASADTADFFDSLAATFAEERRE